MCETERGCPVETEARNEKIEQLVEKYIQAKHLHQSTGLPAAAEGILRSTGLLDDVDLLTDFEGVWVEYLSHRSKEQQRKAKAAKKAKRPPKRRR